MSGPKRETDDRMAIINAYEARRPSTAVLAQTARIGDAQWAARTAAAFRAHRGGTSLPGVGVPR